MSDGQIWGYKGVIFNFVKNKLIISSTNPDIGESKEDIQIEYNGDPIEVAFNPKYFTENQLEDENLHEKLDPKISFQIISRHVADTALILLNDKNFPRDLIEMICQHHGTNIVQYFFDKSGSDVEDNFRYKAEKPKAVESMILMICDSIEAKSRSYIQAGKFDPKAVIEGTINSLLKDGQLDEVVMRLGDLQKIKEALAKELEGTYQKRVDYSKDKEDKDVELPKE